MMSLSIYLCLFFISFITFILYFSSALQLLVHKSCTYFIKHFPKYLMGFPGGASGKEPACQCRRCKRHEFDPESESSPREGNGNLLQYSCLENSMDGGAWWATVHGDLKELDMTE